MLKSTFPILVLPDRKDVRDLRGWWANFGDKKQESQDENKEFGKSGRRGHRRPAEAISNYGQKF